MFRCAVHGKRFCVRCVWFSAGFLIEHAMWEKIPLMRMIPPLLGIH